MNYLNIKIMKTSRHKPSDFVDGMPLETILQVTIEAAFINLIIELGYREDKEWTSDENLQMFKLIDLAEDLRHDIIEELKSQDK